MDNRTHKVVQVESGDVLIGEFGELYHNVQVAAAETAPDWWKHAAHKLGRARCNILFRQALSPADQRNLAHKRALQMYDMSVEEIEGRTGIRDIGQLSMLLRHV